MFEKFLDACYRLLTENATPHRIAFGFAIGLFASFYPAPVVDTVIALALVYWVRGNRAACLIGNSLGLILFPVIPFVLGLEYYIGRALLQLKPSTLTPMTWTFKSFFTHPGETYLSLLLGALVVSIPSAVLGYWIVYFSTSYWQSQHKENE